MNLIRSEFMKIRSTNLWWIFTICMFVFTALAATFWIFAFTNEQLNQAVVTPESFQPDPSSPVSAEQQREQFLANRPVLARVLIQGATQIYTSGQYFTLLFILILGILLITNEFFHQTATATFLFTPKRTKVILAKFGAIGIFSLLFWIGTTALSVIAGSIYFGSKGYGAQLGEWEVQRAILMNLLAFVLWGILGVGLGVLMRSQIGAVVTGSLAYVIGTQAIQIIAAILYFNVFEKPWVFQATVAWPSVASALMVSPDLWPGSGIVAPPPWWVGLLVLIGYGIVFGGLGTLITRKRDIA